MQLLAAFLGTLFTSLFSFFARYLVAEKAARLAGWSLAFAGIVSIISLGYASIAGPIASSIANMTAGNNYFAMGLAIAWNPVTIASAGAYMSVWVACQVYVIKKKAINTIIGG